MSKTVFNKIKNIYHYPCISLILPTHRISSESKQDEIRLKNLIKEATERLEKEFDDRELQPILSFFEQIQQDIDHPYNLEGLAAFINRDICEFVRLPFAVEERVIIDHTFATRDLIRSFYLTEAYYVLTLSQKKVRLFYGVRDHLDELRSHGFPFENEIYTTDRLVNSFSDQEDREIREFFNRIDKDLFEIYKDQPAEVVLAGVEANVAHYGEIADHKELIMTSIHGNFDDASESQIAEKAWPAVKAILDQRQSDIQEKLSVAKGAEKLALGIDEAYRLAQQGRGDLLVVEEGYFQPAKIEGDRINLNVEADAPDVIDDLVDETAEFVYNMKGKVAFVKAATLGEYAPIAMVLRY